MVSFKKGFHPGLGGAVAEPNFVVADLDTVGSVGGLGFALAGYTPDYFPRSAQFLGLKI